MCKFCELFCLPNTERQYPELLIYFSQIGPGLVRKPEK